MKKNAFLILFAGIILFSGCSTRKFAISSVPNDALISVTSKLDSAGKWGTLYFKNPTEAQITFVGKNDAHRIRVDRRGYYPESKVVTRDSALKIDFNMRRIDNTTDQIYDTSGLYKATYLFLPPEIDVTIRSGLGNMIKLKHSDELTKQASDSINKLMKNGNHSNNIAILSTSEKDTLWKEISTKLNDYLMKLNGAKLRYYSYPAEVGSIIQQDTILIGQLKSTCNNYSNPYLIFTSLKCIKESTGRIIGNMGLAIAGGAVDGYNRAMYGTYTSTYDPNAFTLDTGTKIVYFVLDSKTFEVVKIDQNYYGYDLSSKKQRPAFVKELLTYPKLKKH